MTVRIGFIGVGGIATPHLINLQSLEGAEVVALCDVSIDRCEASVARVNGALRARQRPDAEPPRELAARMFTDAKKMLSDAKPDAVYIAVPPFAHGDLERSVVAAGKHLFVEKPVGLSMELAREIESRIKDAGVISCVGYQSRCSDAVDKAREALKEMPIGLVQGTYYGPLPGVAWWKVQAQSGGQIVEQATHTVDLMRFLAGDIASVYAVGSTKLLGDVEGLDIFDVNAATFTFQSGAVGSLLTTCALGGWVGPDWYRGVSLFSRDLVVSVWLDRVTIRRGGSDETHTAKLDAMREADRLFVEAAATGDRSKIRSDYANGVRTLQVTLAALESARSGRPVEL